MSQTPDHSTPVGPLDAAFTLCAIPLVLIARVWISVTPFKIYSRWLGNSRDNDRYETLTTSREEIILASRIGSSVSRAARLARQSASCLPQAMVTCFMLRRAGIGYYATIGAALDKDADSGMVGHAWVTVGERIVSGEVNSSRHTALAHFVSR